MSTLPRLYVSNDLNAEAVFSLADGQGHYLTRVLRLGLGGKVRLFNGRHGEWLAQLDEVRGRQAFVAVSEELKAQPASVCGPRLLFAPLKKARMDFAVEKATELGVSVLQPVITSRTQTRNVRLDRLRMQTIEAAEQTERFDLPQVDEPQPLVAALGEVPAGETLVFCDEAPGAPPMAAALGKLGSGISGGILIGPEGGFASDERAYLKSLDFVIPVSLGPRILRAETAIVSALTIWQAVLGDWV